LTVAANTEVEPTFLPAPLHTVLHSICRPPDAFPPQPPTIRPACEADCMKQSHLARTCHRQPCGLCLKRSSDRLRAVQTLVPKEFISSSPRIRGFGSGFRPCGLAALLLWCVRVRARRRNHPSSPSSSAPVIQRRFIPRDAPPYAGSQAPRNAMQPMGSLVRSSRL